MRFGVDGVYIYRYVYTWETEHLARLFLRAIQILFIASNSEALVWVGQAPVSEAVLLGAPVVSLYPFFGVPLLKPNSRKKGTLIIKRLRGNLGYAGIYGSSLLGFGLKGPSLWLSALFISSSAIVAFPRDSDTECTLNCNGLHVVIHAILLVLGVLGSTPSPNANTSSIKHEHNHCYRGLQRRYVQYAPVVTEMSYCK